MQAKKSLRRLIVLGLFVSVTVTAVPRMAEGSGNGRSEITVNIGQPSVWSLAQAHYLLAGIRQANRTLQIPLQNGALDPNANNGSRMDILRTFIGADVQYSEVAGIQNRSVIQKYQADLNRRDTVQRRLDVVTQQYLDAVREQTEMTGRLAGLTGTDTATEQQRKELGVAIEQKKVEVGALNTQMTTLGGQLSQAPALGSLNSTAPFSGALPGAQGGDLDKIITAIAEKATPKLSASIALDNYVQMQYELVAKQLTLLRDEVRPGERLIFMELPSDIYSVPKTDDDFIVQVEWSVTGYFGKDKESDLERKYRGRSRQYEPISLEAINESVILKSKLDSARLARATEFAVNDYPAYLEHKEREASRIDGVEPRQLTEKERQSISKINAILALPEFEAVQLIYRYPGIFNMDWKPTARPQGSSSPSRFRVVDIIPRQSALNVNDTQAQTKGFALAARFLTIFGLGGQVDYTRQRTLYGQFMQQEVYASGFGKGSDHFGWTFGAVPGTRRLAPGVRTTYAIMAIPENALAIRLQPAAKIYPRTTSPDATPARVVSAMDLLIPGERTQGFWIDGVSYAPVRKGERITVTLHGQYFSPLTGILVDGVPLRRAVSIAKNESETTTLASAIDAFGEYEYLNPNEIIISFKMPDANYVGTPSITLVTPEKTSPINNFPLRVNGRSGASLAEKTASEPMFLDQFSLSGVAVVEPPTVSVAPNEMEVRLTGAGFRQGAQIFIDSNPVPVAPPKRSLLSSNEYQVVIAPAKKDRWTVTYRSGTNQASRSYVEAAPSIEAIENPSTGKAEGSADGGDIVTIRGNNLAKVAKVFFGQKSTSPETPQDDRILFVRVPPAEEGGVQVFVEAPGPLGSKRTNIGDFISPGKSIYKYTASRKQKPSSAPSIQSIENPTTGNATGWVDSDATAVIRGVNLGEVEHVKFGDAEAQIMNKDPHSILVQVPKSSVELGVPVRVETADKPGTGRLNNFADFETPGRAFYKYVAKPGRPSEAQSKTGGGRPASRRSRRENPSTKP